MAWLQIEWQFQIFDEEERTDEPALRFAIVRIIDGRVDVQMHETGELGRPGNITPRGGRNVWAGQIESEQPAPDEQNPYFGFCVQATERDSSSDREGDALRFQLGIQNVCQEVVDQGVVPLGRVLWAAANSAHFTDIWGDIDEWIGTSSWQDPDYGAVVAPHVALESDYSDGQVISATGEHDRRTMRFVRSAADYRLTWEHRMAAGSAPTGYTGQGWRNASWG